MTSCVKRHTAGEPNSGPAKPLRPCGQADAGGLWNGAAKFLRACGQANACGRRFGPARFLRFCRQLGAGAGLALALALCAALAVPPVQAADGTPQERAIARLNELRAHAQSPPVQADPALRRAAEAHAAYYALHGFTGHTQDPENAGFFGATPTDRIRAAGFSGRCTAESALSLADDPIAAVDALVNSVYHRTAMLHPALTFVGYGQSAGGSVFDLGGCFENAEGLDRLYIYPGAGQTGVPVGFRPRTEQPNPLPDVTGYVGSPISIGVAPWVRENLALTGVQIVDEHGAVLPFRRVDDDSWAYFLTDLPLGAGQTFTVSVAGTAVGSAVGDFSRTWSFTTVSAYRPTTIHIRFVEGTPRLLEQYVTDDYACYGQTSGQTPTLAGAEVTLPCYDVVDESAWYGVVPFLAEYRRVGGEDALGYPLTRAITFEGKPTQIFQKGILQWQPDSGAFAYLNVFDLLSARGLDPLLETRYLIPPSFDTAADDGLTWEQVMARHIAIMDDAPAIATLVLGTPNWLDRYGLPMSARDYGDVVVVRAQRAAFQWWRTETPFADAGEVTVVHGGEVAKELGAFVR